MLKLGKHFSKPRTLGPLDIDAGPRLTKRAEASPRDALPAMYADFFDAWEALHAPSGELLNAEQIRTRKELAAQHLVGIAHLIRLARNAG